MLGCADQVVQAIGIPLQVVELLLLTVAKHSDAFGDKRVVSRRLIHGPHCQTFVVISVPIGTIAPGVEDVAEVTVLDATHGHSRSARFLVDLRKHAITAALRFTPNYPQN